MPVCICPPWLSRLARPMQRVAWPRSPAWRVGLEKHATRMCPSASVSCSLAIASHLPLCQLFFGHSHVPLCPLSHLQLPPMPSHAGPGFLVPFLLEIVHIAYCLVGGVLPRVACWLVGGFLAPVWPRLAECCTGRHVLTFFPLPRALRTSDPSRAAPLHVKLLSQAQYLKCIS
jgi:hypothetical protein